MEMHQLRYFVAVAEANSFSRAAEACFVSQPSLSQQIAKLEAELGRRLFDRQGRKVRLTDAGRQFLESASAVLGIVEDTRRRLRDDDNLAGCRLFIGAIPTIAPYLLPDTLRRFQKRFSEVEITVTEDVTRHLIASLVSGEMDLAVMALPIEDDRLTVEPLWTEPLLLTLPRGHRLARKKRITFDDLRGERFLLLTEMHCLGEQVLSYCRTHECLPAIACHSAQIATMQALVGQGLGITLLPEMATRGKSDRRIVIRKLHDGPTRTIVIVWNKHRYHTSAAERFFELLRERARTIR